MDGRYHVSTPVVLIVFNRPETARQVIKAISAAQPGTLYVLADGPREGNERDTRLCRETRDVVDAIDWPCDVVRRYSDTNLGLRRNVSEGLNWVFERCERAIVLEDDCVPHPSFFRFCDEMLERYQNDDRIMVVSGNNFQRPGEAEFSYYFSRYAHIWGWATWRDAWRHYGDLDHWPEQRDNAFPSLLENSDSRSYWSAIFDEVYEGDWNTSWAYRWQYSCWRRGGLTILPSRNLVLNIGFGKDATHTRGGRADYPPPAAELKFPLRHPHSVERDVRADRFTQTNLFDCSITNRVRRAVGPTLWRLVRRVRKAWATRRHRPHVAARVG